MGKESDLWQYLGNPLKKLGLWMQRIETTIGTGTPDVVYKKRNFEGGWIELKVIDEFPKRASTTVQINHFEPQQRNWLRLYPGDCWVIVKVMATQEYFLFEGKDAAKFLGETWQTADWHLFNRGYWKRSIDFSRLLTILLEA